MRSVLRVLALAATLVLAVVGAVLSLPLARYEPDQAAAITPRTTSVVSRDTDLPVNGKVNLAWSDQRTVKATRTLGTVVTAVFARPGRIVKCGSRLLEVDGQPLLSLCGDRPLWRPVTGGMKGPDVTEVIALLRAAGQLTTPTPTGRQLTDAIEAWQRRNGLAVTGSLAPDAVIWIRAPLTPSLVTVQPGDLATAGMTVLTVEPHLAAARFVGTAPHVTSVARIINISGQPDTVSIDASGKVTQLLELERIVRAGVRSGDALPGTLDAVSRLSQAVTLDAVPSGAIVSGRSETCVLVADQDGLHSVRVTVVDSEIDAALVTGDLRAGEQVITSPDGSAKC